MRRRRLTPLRIALILGVGLSILRFNGCVALQQIDTRAIDLRLRQRGVEAASPEILIVAVDDASLERVGRWPWPRATLARLVDEVSAGEPAVIGFDIVQSETSAAPLVRGLRERVEGVDDETWASVRRALVDWTDEERILADSLAASGRAVLGYFFEFDRRSADEAASRTAAAELTDYNVVQPSNDGRGESFVPRATDAVVNLAELRRSALGTGYFNVIPDQRDGVYRRTPLAIRYDDEVALPLSMALLRAYWDDAAAVIRFAEFGVESVRLGPRTIPVAEDGQMLLNYRGPGRTFEHVAAADILDGRVAPETFRDRIVLLGVTAIGVADIRATPFDGVFPGVEIQATAIDNILRDDFLLLPKWVVLVEIAIVLLIALTLGLLLRHARGLFGAAVAVALALVYLAATQWLFVSSGVPLGLFFPVMAIVVIYAAISIEHFVREESEKRHIREAFGLYLNPELARRVSEQPELLELGGQKRSLTVLFSDIRGFTSISEKLEPEALVELLNVYLGEMTDVIFERDGTLDKYIGDAIMAVWGAPVAQPDQAARACLAAVEMMERMDGLATEFAGRGWPVLEIGIGLHAGEMVVGNMGSERRLSYTVVGDNVNVGSRLEGLTKLYGASIIASEEVLAAADGAVVARELDLVQVKGKARPVRIFEVLGRGQEGERWALLRERFGAALAAYRERRWDDALQAFETVLADLPDDGPSKLYAERCRRFQSAEPDDAWQGVAVMEAK